MKQIHLIIFLFVASLIAACSKEEPTVEQRVINTIEKETIYLADSFLLAEPVTVTSFASERSAGGIHDFYSEGDYWWPDPENPEGPYIRKDGQSNPGNFSEHRKAMIRMSEEVSTLTSAWMLTSEKKYADKALEHLKAWFVDTTTLMNPNMLYAQAIWGRYTGRGIGLIDAYHLVEVAQSAYVLIEKKGISADDGEKIKAWFAAFLDWMTTHPYGIAEMNAKNNHGTCWAVTAGMFAKLVDNKEQLLFCRDRFKNVLLPNQMAADGSFPLELERTKPYGYSLFNMDAMANLAEILSVPNDDLWQFTTSDGRSLQKGMEFLFPYISDKNSWPFAKDIYIWDEWPVRQSCLLFTGIAYQQEEYIDTFLKLPAYSTNDEVIRNLPVRHPVIWLANQR